MEIYKEICFFVLKFNCPSAILPHFDAVPYLGKRVFHKNIMYFHIYRFEQKLQL